MFMRKLKTNYYNDNNRTKDRHFPDHSCKHFRHCKPRRINIECSFQLQHQIFSQTAPNSLSNRLMSMATRRIHPSIQPFIYLCISIYLSVTYARQSLRRVVERVDQISLPNQCWLDYCVQRVLISERQQLLRNVKKHLLLEHQSVSRLLAPSTVQRHKQKNSSD